jgi:GMP synthase (glutamine-hydrolysing)
MTIDANLNLCIINGYPERSRDALDAASVTQAHDLYLRFLEKMAPNSNLDVFFIADLANELPEGHALHAYDAYIWTGSNLTIYDEDLEVTRQVDFSRSLYEAGIPQFGSCWGVQMAAMAAGGMVAKNPNGREWSIARDIELTEAGRAHPMYSGKQHKFDGFIMHLDEVTVIPEGASMLATNAHTHIQALAVKHPSGGEFWATQYHPEFTLYEMARLLVARKKYLVQEGFFDEEGDVDKLVEQMTELSHKPDDPHLRGQLNIHNDILDDRIRQSEVHNWLEHLVIPKSKNARR